MTRADRVEARLEDVDVLLVSDLVNLRYLTGFTGTNGLALIGPGVRRFVTDSRYTRRAAAEVDGFDVEEAPAVFLEAVKGLEGRIGFEDQHVSVRQHGKLAELVGGELVAAGGLVEAERAVKDEDELAAIRAAAALADEALREGISEDLVGRTEREVALVIEGFTRRQGGEPAFPTIVAAGENGASPHAVPRDVVIERGQLVTIDWGARLDGYCSDCTRTFSTRALSGALARICALVEEAQAAGVAAVRAGASGKDVDAVAREVIEAAGHGEHFGHGLGHGVGLEVHEAPRLARTSKDTLAAGNVVTVEPGVYVPGLGGLRIEDLVVVGAGEPEVISGHPKSVIELD